MPTMMQRKFNRMFLGGTIGIAVVSIAVMSGSFIAGSVIGKTAVSAVTLVAPLLSLAVFFSYAVSQGFPLLYSKAMGRMDKQKADHIFGTTLFVSIIMGIILFLLSNILSNLYFRLYAPSDAVLSLAVPYLFWLRFGILIMPLACVLNSAIYADGDESIYTISMVAQLIVTLAFGIILSNTWGIEGISFSLSLGLLVALALSFLHWFKKSNTLRMNLRFNMSYFRKLLRYSIGDAASHLFQAVFSFVMNVFIIANFGEDFLAVSAALSIIHQVQAFCAGVGTGAAPIIGTYLGEKSTAGVKSIYRLAERTAIVMGILFTAVVIVLSLFISRLLGITDPRIAHIVINGTRIVSLTSVFVSLLYWMTTYYLISKHVWLCVVVNALKEAVVALPMAILFTWIRKDALGIFIGICLVPLLVWFGTFIYIHLRYKGQNAKLLLKEQPHNSYIFALEIEPKDIVTKRHELAETLKKEGCDRKTILRAAFLFEELFMLIHDKNASQVQGECCVNVGEKIELIARDNGVFFDMTDPDMKVTSLRAYLVSSAVDTMAYQSQHVAALAFNRNRIVIQRTEPDTANPEDPDEESHESESLKDESFPDVEI